jgi:flagellar FliL protein
MSAKKKAVVAVEEQDPGHIVEGEAPPKKKKSKLMFIIIGVVVLLLAVAGGLCFAGIIKLPFMSHAKPKKAVVVEQVQFIKVPELIANLDAGPDNDSYAKMQAELEVTDAASAAAVNAQMPAIIDLFQTYMRTMQPDDLRGSEGLYRLREALLARANVVVAPASVQNVLFIEMIVQ